MAADDLLRLAWEAQHDGRASLRDALITLAILEGDPDADWIERARHRLILDHPKHFLAAFSSARDAQGDPRVIETARWMRLKYPSIRVSRMLLGAQAARGPYPARVESILAMIDDLFAQPAEAENVRADAAQATRGPLVRQRSTRPALASLAYPRSIDWTSLIEKPDEPIEAEPIARFYLRVLLTVAVLLAIVQEPVIDRHGQADE